ncbi:P-loop containing nucleoside triphosphate hydrolase protein [Calocera viscosa TUFC12733]|uniref:p-loop containing nucleoside triphosphate hydrolase protein n=1 Tax=Calocera viscosa (strain TUFC12733) TaxID=1330018 RepID=A0A167LGM8_CALVF|nr:P-loop containing nucleoside triphosphate hydrolase protein [Calocera viscosa TUFC12733]
MNGGNAPYGNGYGIAGALYDPLKLFVIGGTVETSRRLASSAWSHFINSFFLTAHFSEEDFPFDWLMHWLAKQPAWHRSREFETTTCSSSSHALWKTAQFDADSDLWGEHTQEDDPTGKPSMKVVFRPTLDTTHTIFFKGHWLRVRRTRSNGGIEMLSISVVARSNTILKSLVLQAKREYEQDSEHRIQIYFADSHGSFRWTDSRHKRPMSSIVLEDETKNMLMNDCRDFLRPESEKWYADRGIPYRRGYLLWGVPGSGKTSSIHAIAGELDLDIYVITLSSSWINDATLTSLMGRVPARCILLLEDLDAAFTRSTTRGKKDNGVPRDQQQQQQQSTLLLDANSMPYSSTHMHHHTLNGHNQGLSDTNTLSLSGLLNSLDGVAASEGRLLFATTNHITRLDPALSRPGRMDVWIEFRNATKWQMESLFMNFFPSAPKEAVEALEREDEALEKESRMAVSGPSSSSASISDSSSSTKASRSGTKVMSEPALRSLAKKFADSIPADEFSVAALQGYLLKHKTSAIKAVEEAAAWVISERQLRERLKREKEEKEREEEKQRQKEEDEEREKDKKETWRRKREERLKREKEEEERKAEEEEEKAEREAAAKLKTDKAKPAEEKKEPAEKESAKKEAAAEKQADAGLPTPKEEESPELEASMLADSDKTPAVKQATASGWVRIPASEAHKIIKEDMIASVLAQPASTES